MREIAVLYNGLIRYGCVAVAGATLVATVLLVLYDVLVRTAGYSPPASTNALSEYAMLLITMAIAPYLVRTHGHVFVEALVRLLPERHRIRLSRAMVAACALISAVVTYYAVEMAIESHLRGELDIRSIAVPRAALFLLLASGFGLSAMEFVRHLWLRNAIGQGSAETPGL